MNSAAAPMKIFILVLGTRGDLEPFLALGRELIARGHSVMLGTSAFHEERIEKSGIPWVKLGDSSQEHFASVQRSLTPIDSLTERTRQYYLRWLQPQFELAKNQITAIGAQADYFISNIKLALQKNGNILPGAFVTYDPPATISDLQRYGSHQHGVRTIELVAMNAKLLDPEGKWGPQFHFTGFWRHADSAEWSPPESFADFMSSGPAPVVITMGSMTMFDVNQFSRDILRAVELSGQRAVIIGSWSGIGDTGETMPPNTFCMHDVPYDWLFPRASCVIHHGGVGTVAAVLRAGIPSILLPQILCQAKFSEILTEKKLVAGVFDVRNWQPEDVATAIREAVANEQLRQSAHLWQRIVHADPGVTAAADQIETHWQGIQNHDH